MKPHNRKLQLKTNETHILSQEPKFIPHAHAPHPLLQSTKKPPQQPPNPNPNPNAPFDSSMALTVLVLLTALFFMGFFSIYIRRFASADSSSDISTRRRRRRRRHNDNSPIDYPRRPRSSAPRGVDPSTVGSLPVYCYHGDAKHPIDCAVCLSEFEDEDEVKMIPYCGHVFHSICIDTWLSSHVSCPLCRTTRLFPVEERCLNVNKQQFDQGVSESEEGVDGV